MHRSLAVSVQARNGVDAEGDGTETRKRQGRRNKEEGRNEEGTKGGRKSPNYSER